MALMACNSSYNEYLGGDSSFLVHNSSKGHTVKKIDVEMYWTSVGNV